MARKTLRVSKIKKGTVIDHITGGHALDVIKILEIKGRAEGVVTVAMNVPSKRHGTKDVVKVEGRELNPKEVDKIALLAPHATINIIRDYPACISNSSEPVQPTFYVEKEDPLRLRCHYCGYIMEKQDVLKQF